MSTSSFDALIGARLLLVDDDADFISYMASLFRHAGVGSIESVYSGLEALEALAADGDYDLIVTDVRMPTPSGIQLVTMARTADYEVPFLVVTAFPDAKVLQQACQHRATDILGKPFAPEKLLEVASKLLESARVAA